MPPSQEDLRCEVKVGAYRLLKVRIYRAMRMPAGRTTKNENPASKPCTLTSFLKSTNCCWSGGPWPDMIVTLDRQGSESGVEKGLLLSFERIRTKEEGYLICSSYIVRKLSPRGQYQGDHRGCGFTAASAQREKNLCSRRCRSFMNG